MTNERGAGEPPSRGQLDRQAAEASALRDTLVGVVLVAGVVLVNGILAILFIALLHALGIFVPASETAFLSTDGAAQLRTTLHSLADRRAPATA